MPFHGRADAHSADALSALLAQSDGEFLQAVERAADTTSGASWSPNSCITYGGDNRTHMIRIPDAGRFELRLADGAANPYLLQAAILAAGLDGMRNARDPGQRLDINMYTDGHTVTGVKTLPLNMLDAIRALDRCDVLKQAFGSFVPSYIKLKTEEWNAFSRHLTMWERDNTLDC